MQPNHNDLLGQRSARMTREEHRRENALQSRSPSGVLPLRSEGMFVISYIASSCLPVFPVFLFDVTVGNMCMLYSTLGLLSCTHFAIT